MSVLKTIGKVILTGSYCYLFVYYGIKANEHVKSLIK